MTAATRRSRSRCRTAAGVLLAAPLLALLAALTGCEGRRSERPARDLPHLHGLDEAAVVRELGRPVRENTFKMGECCTEFRVELLNTYPPDDPRHRDVQIRELWWKDGHVNTAVWFHQVDGE